MARLRHFAVCVNDLDKAAAFYESVFDLTHIGREDLEIGSAIYMSDGVINLALLNFKGSRGSEASDLKNPSGFVGAHHFGFQVDDLAETQKRIASHFKIRIPILETDGFGFQATSGPLPGYPGAKQMTKTTLAGRPCHPK